MGTRTSQAKSPRMGIANKAKARTVRIDKIRIDGGTQIRVAIDEATVGEYAEAVGALPSVVLFDDGVDLWLGDGFHRLHAHRKAGAASIKAEVRQGTRQDAVLYAVGANAHHGLRRTNADKRKAVETLLADAEWGKWSDREIARRCAVDHAFVGKVRRELSGDGHQMRTAERNGTTYQIDTAGIGGKGDVGGEEGEDRAPTDRRSDAENGDDGGSRARDTGDEEGGPRTPADGETAAAAATETTKPTPRGVVDEVGFTVPDRLLAVFAARDDFDTALQQLTQFTTTFNRLAGDPAKGREPGPASLHLSQYRTTLSKSLSDVRNHVRFSRPYAVCPHCGGKGCSTSLGCKGVGWFNEDQYRSAPNNLKRRATA